MGAESTHFTTMAQRIEHNADATFGGAVVIVPPINAGDPIEYLILSTADAVLFWSTVKSQAQSALDKLSEKAQLQRGFGVR